MTNISYGYLPKPIKKESNLVNEAIRFPKVMLIDENGISFGAVDRQRALQLALDKGLDLVCVAPQAQPPVCKIMNYSKFRYEKEKKEKEAAKNQKIVDTKEIQLSPTIAEHDFNTKLTQGRKFLDHGDKVKITLRIKKRFIPLTEQAMKLVMDYVEKCDDIASSERKRPDFDGKIIQITISPKKKTPGKKEETTSPDVL